MKLLVWLTCFCDKVCPAAVNVSHSLVLQQRSIQSYRKWQEETLADQLTMFIAAPEEHVTFDCRHMKFKCFSETVWTFVSILTKQKMKSVWFVWKILSPVKQMQWVEPATTFWGVTWSNPADQKVSTIALNNY